MVGAGATDVRHVECPTCRLSRRMVSVRVLRGDVLLTMHACSACETRWWERDGRPVPLVRVLELAPERE